MSTQFPVRWLIVLESRHAATGFTTHSINGQPMKRPVELRIVRNPDEGVLLLYCRRDGSAMNDTWHLTEDDAKKQAEREFGVRAEEWSVGDSQDQPPFRFDKDNDPD